MIPFKYQLAKLEDFPEKLKDIIKDALKNRRGLYIFGDIGTGKTHLVYALKNEIDKKYPNCILIKNTTELLYNIRQDFDRPSGLKEYPENEAERATVLVLDDIGAEKMTDWVAEVFYLIINHRYNNMQPTIFTSNLPIKNLAAKIGDRIVSRIVETCDIIELVGPDKRFKNLKEKIKINF